MLGELPKLFGKAFAIGYLLPATAISIALFALLAAFEIDTPVLAVLKEKDLLGATLALVVLWFFGIVLMALNRPIVRLLEGYGALNPFRIKLGWEQRTFRELTQTIEQAEGRMAAAEAASMPVAAEDEKLFIDASQQLARDFPHEIGLLLPTRFGNVIRSFEVYSTVIYGLEGIDGWSRLIAVIPADYRDAIEQAKAQTDFWVNLWLGGIICACAYVYLALWEGAWPHLWIPVVAIACSFIAAVWARAMARGWGMLVMSAFDLFRGELCAKLGLSMPRSIEKEREMWGLLSQVMVYRAKDTATQMTQYRAHEKQ